MRPAANRWPNGSPKVLGNLVLEPPGGGDWQVAVWCAPSSAKPVTFSWSNFASFHEDCVWQSAQAVPREPRCTSSGVWQLAQAMGMSFQRLAEWQAAHGICAWRACSAKRVLPWS
jgi:hypothetical protein